jgi:acetoin utilization deacetylase AcuC-like enzyme
MNIKNQRLGILFDYDFSKQHNPPYPHPSFISYENPLRIKTIYNYFEKIRLFEDERIIKLVPRIIGKKLLTLAHSQYYIDTVRRLSQFGSGLLSEEVFVVKDTYLLAKKAIGGVIECIDAVLNHRVDHSFALVRPPGHHAMREKGAGLCIFNNIAASILNLKKNGFDKKIAIIDIDDHFGDGIAQYFYEDPDVLYFSVHEFDFLEGDIGFITETGAKRGKGTTINFPIPMNTTDDNFLEFMDILKPVLKEFRPELIIVAVGVDMYFADQIGNCLLTSKSYYDFTHAIKEIAEDLCDGQLVLVLEGGYNLIGLPVCVHSIIRALLQDKYISHDFEHVDFSKYRSNIELLKIKEALRAILSESWTCFDNE